MWRGINCVGACMREGCVCVLVYMCICVVGLRSCHMSRLDDNSDEEQGMDGMNATSLEVCAMLMCWVCI